jgi:hypothetical protein
MKKHNVVALVGTLALLANLLVPGLAFGADTAGQAGTLSTICGGATTASFSITPAASFTFWPDGSAGLMYSSISAQQAYNNPNGAALTVTTGNDYIEVTDTRNPSGPTCSDGFTVTLAALNPGNPTETRFFDSNDGIATGNYIPLTDTYVVSNSDTCPAGSTEVGDVCFDAAALCGNGENLIASACQSADGTTSSDYTGTDFATLATFTAAGDALGSAANTPTTLNVLSFADNAELFGKAGLGVSYGVNIPGGTPAGTYTLNLQYTLSIPVPAAN